MTTHLKLKQAIAILLFVILEFISGCVSSTGPSSARQQFNDNILTGLAKQTLKEAGKADKEYLIPVYSALRNKQYNNAINQAENLKTSHPNDEDLFYLQGIAYLEKNDLKSALACFEKTISMNHARGDAYYYKALMLYKLDKSNKALNSINTAINNEKAVFQLMNQEKLRYGGDWTVEGRRATLFFLRAVINKDLNKFHAALSDVDIAISTSPYKSASHFGLRGELYFFKSEFSLAYNDLHKAVELDPGHANSWATLGVINFFNGNYQTAITHYEKAIQIHPEKYNSFLADIGLSYWLLGNRNKALETMGGAIGKRPGYNNIYYHLAYFHHLMGNQAQVRINFKKAEQLDPDILEFYLFMLKNRLPKESPTYTFYQQEYQTAKKYLGAGKRVTAQADQNTKPTLKITGLDIIPDPVPVNTAFDIRISFRPDIPGAGNNKFPMVLYFKIYKNKKLLFTSKNISLDTFNKKIKSWTHHMDPVPKAGVYEIHTFVKYKEIFDKKNIKLTIK